MKNNCSSPVSVFISKYKQLGLLGLAEKACRKAKKFLCWLWYFSRFSKIGKRVVFEGSLRLSGGRGITIGNNVIFGENVKLDAAAGAEMSIGDNCYIADNVVLASKGSMSIGSGCSIHEGSVVAGERIRIGKDVWVSRSCSVEGLDVTVEDYAILSPFVFIIDTDHYIDKETGRITMDRGESAPVHVGENSWICNGSRIVKGVKIGRGSIVAAGSVVTKDIPERSVAGGVPARVIKKRA